MKEAEGDKQMMLEKLVELARLGSLADRLRDTSLGHCYEHVPRIYALAERLLATPNHRYHDDTNHVLVKVTAYLALFEDRVRTSES